MSQPAPDYFDEDWDDTDYDDDGADLASEGMGWDG